MVIVIGDDDDQDDTDQSSLPHAKLRYDPLRLLSPLPVSSRPLSAFRPDRLIITTLGKGRLFDTFEEKRLQPPISDLFVYLNAAQLFSVGRRSSLFE